MAHMSDPTLNGLSNLDARRIVIERTMRFTAHNASPKSPAQRIRESRRPRKPIFSPIMSPLVISPNQSPARSALPSPVGQGLVGIQEAPPGAVNSEPAVLSIPDCSLRPLGLFCTWNSSPKNTPDLCGSSGSSPIVPSPLVQHSGRSSPISGRLLNWGEAAALESLDDELAAAAQNLSLYVHRCPSPDAFRDLSSPTPQLCMDLHSPLPPPVVDYSVSDDSEHSLVSNASGRKSQGESVESTDRQMNLSLRAPEVNSDPSGQLVRALGVMRPRVISCREYTVSDDSGSGSRSLTPPTPSPSWQ